MVTIIKVSLFVEFKYHVSDSIKNNEKKRGKNTKKKTKKRNNNSKNKNISNKK